MGSCLFVLISFRHVQMTFYKNHNLWNFLKNCWQKSENLSFNFHTGKTTFFKLWIWGNSDDFKKNILFYSVPTLSEGSPCAIHKNIMILHSSWKFLFLVSLFCVIVEHYKVNKTLMKRCWRSQLALFCKNRKIMKLRSQPPFIPHIRQNSGKLHSESNI